MTHSNQPQVSLRQQIHEIVLPHSGAHIKSSLVNDLVNLYEATTKEVIGSAEDPDDHIVTDDLQEDGGHYSDWITQARKYHNELRAEQLARLAALLRGEGE